MKAILERSGERGHAHIGWLDAYYSFSYGDYQNPERMGFGALQFLNDNTIAIGHGFQATFPTNMVLISFPLKGSLHYHDSFEHDGMVRWGQLHVLDTGNCSVTTKYENISELHQVEFLQIGILPEARDKMPNYKVVDFMHLLKENQFTLILAPDDDTPPVIRQYAWISVGEFHQGMKTEYLLQQKGNGIYVFVLGGAVNVAGHELESKDGLEITATQQVDFSFTKNSAVLIIEVPMEV